MSLSRSRNGMIGGVASGLAETFNIDATLVRLAFVIVTLLGGSGVLVYLALWVILPRAEGGTIAEEQYRKARTWYDGRKGSGPNDYNI